jgi:uncharacterized damage-inducible protein DinB
MNLVQIADYSSFSSEELIAAYENGADAVKAAVSNITEVELQTRIAPGKWSILEVLCHIADFEVINAERVRRVLSEHEPTLFNGEPDDFERALVYEQRNSQEELTLIQAIRSQTGRILRNVPAEAWQRRGIHSTDGPITLRVLVERVTSHIPHHVGFIQQKRIAIAEQK